MFCNKIRKHNVKWSSQQNTQIIVCHTREFCRSLLSAVLLRKLTNVGDVSGEKRHTTPGENCLHLKTKWVPAIKIERTQIHFCCDVFTAVVVRRCSSSFMAKDTYRRRIVQSKSVEWSFVNFYLLLFLHKIAEMEKRLAEGRAELEEVRCFVHLPFT